MRNLGVEEFWVRVVGEVDSCCKLKAQSYACSAQSVYQSPSLDEKLDIFLRGIPKTAGTKGGGAWVPPMMARLNLSFIIVLPGCVAQNKYPVTLGPPPPASNGAYLPGKLSVRVPWSSKSCV